MSLPISWFLRRLADSDSHAPVKEEVNLWEELCLMFSLDLKVPSLTSVSPAALAEALSAQWGNRRKQPPFTRRAQRRKGMYPL